MVEMKTFPTEAGATSPEDLKALVEQMKDYASEDKGVDVFLHGPAGSGKSYTAATFPEPILWIDTERRARRLADKHFKDKKIDVVCPLVLKKKLSMDGKAIDFEQSLNNIRKLVIEINNEVHAKEFPYKTVIVESASDLWFYCQEKGKERLSRAGRVDRQTLALKNIMDWGPITGEHNMLITVLRSLTHLGVNLVITAREDKYGDFSATKTGKEFNLRCQKDLPYFVGTEFALRIGKSSRAAIPLRLDGLDILGKEPMVNLNYDKIIEVLKGD